MLKYLDIPPTDPAFFPSDLIIEKLHPQVLFVAGTNEKGIHGSGSAKTARVHFGAQLGIGEGVTGQTYALPTCRAPGVPLQLPEIEKYVARFKQFVLDNPLMYFAVTAVGTGYAGYDHHHIAPMFKGIPRCWFPDNWKPYIL